MLYQALNPKSSWLVLQTNLKTVTKMKYQIGVNNHWGDQVSKDMQQRVHRGYLWEEKD